MVVAAAAASTLASCAFAGAALFALARILRKTASIILCIEYFRSFRLLAGNARLAHGIEHLVAVARHEVPVGVGGSARHNEPRRLL